tara:strand:- start:30 stop:470 length:441 start_codon:yes stop_codon:yes gene_type:complete
MPKTFDSAPQLPKMRRRIGRDTTEALVTIMALSTTALVFLILVRWDFLDITSDSEYNFIKYFSIGFSLLLWLIVIRLELTAKNKAERLYKVQMKEYEIMRTKWLEIASRQLEMDAKRKNQPDEKISTGFTVVDKDSKEPIIVGQDK